MTKFTALEYKLASVVWDTNFKRLKNLLRGGFTPKYASILEFWFSEYQKSAW